DRNVWECDSGASSHMTGNVELVFNREAPPKGQEWVRIGDGTPKKVLCVGTLNLEFHCDTDVGVQLPRVYVVDGLAINLFSLHAVQAKHTVTLDSTGVHLLGGKISFPRCATGSFLRATRLSPSYPVKTAAVATVS
ncbi:unnamed protein product, partial [Laminaria digitata]